MPLRNEDAILANMANQDGPNKNLNKSPKWLRKLYQWVLGYAQHPKAEMVMASISFIEAVVFPIPIYPMLIAMGAAKPKLAIRYSFVATVSSVAGGITGYALGFYMWSHVSGFFYTYLMDQAKMESLFALLSEHAFTAVLTAGLTPIPYKVFTISAGVAGIPLVAFIAASTLSRGLRFFAIGTLLYFYGPQIKAGIEKNLNKVAIGIFLLLVVLIGIYEWIRPF